MNNFMVVIFLDEAIAYQGSHALKLLDAQGGIALYGIAMVVKDSKGVLSVREAADEGPLTTSVRALVAGLLGLIGYPEQAAAGCANGALIGSFGNLLKLGLSVDFLSAISTELTPGKAAIVTEVVEHGVTPIDTWMEALGGVVLREWRSDFEANQLEKEVGARLAELALLKAEYAQAKAERKANLLAKIDIAKAHLKLACDRADARLARLQRETDAKIDSLQVQASQARVEAKAMIEQRRVSVRSDRERRAAKLEQAIESAKRALKKSGMPERPAEHTQLRRDSR